MAVRVTGETSVQTLCPYRFYVHLEGTATEGHLSLKMVGMTSGLRHPARSLLGPSQPPDFGRSSPGPRALPIRQVMKERPCPRPWAPGSQAFRNECPLPGGREQSGGTLVPTDRFGGGGSEGQEGRDTAMQTGDLGGPPRPRGGSCRPTPWGGWGLCWWRGARSLLKNLSPSPTAPCPSL